MAEINSYLVGSLVTGGFALGAAALAQFGEGKRRIHETILRNGDYEHDHHERLQDTRIVAYERLEDTFARSRQAYYLVNKRWGSVQYWWGKVGTGEPEERVKADYWLTESKRQFDDAASQAASATAGVETALAAVAIVSSPEVRRSGRLRTVVSITCAAGCKTSC